MAINQTVRIRPSSLLCDLPAITNDASKMEKTG
jgi:hypothetical protein